MTILDADTMEDLFEVTAPDVDNPVDLIGDEPVETIDGEINILPRFEPDTFRYLFLRIIVSGIKTVVFGYERFDAAIEEVPVSIKLYSFKNRFVLILVITLLKTSL